MIRKITRRRALAVSAALGAGSFARVVSAAPPAEKITPALIDAALETARRENFACHRGVYVAVTGPVCYWMLRPYYP